jgi:EmrB/QacA subfamily drug resistance transporter
MAEGDPIAAGGPAPPETPPDGARKWLVMTSVAAGIFLGTIDGSIVNIALPVLERDLRTDFASVQWVVLAYLLASTALLPAAGRLSDMFGRKSLYVGGFAVFTLGSVLCGLARSVEWLIACRVLQAAGGSLVMALGAAIVTETFPARERGRALGMVGAMVSIGLVSGPTAGGLILGSWSWPWIFYVNLPVGLAGIALAVRFIPPLKPGRGQAFDFPGAASLLAALLALLLGLTLGQRQGFLATAPLALLGASAVSLALFVRRELRAPDPLLAPDLFRNRSLRVNLVTGFLTFFCAQATVLLMPFYLQNVKGYDPRDAGLLLVTVPAAMGIMAPIAGSLSDRIGTRPLTSIGLAVLLAGYIGLRFLEADTSAAGYVLMFLPIGMGAGLFQSPNNSAIMGAASRGRLGVASSLIALTRVMGVTTGVAVMGALWAHWVGAIAGSGPTGHATAAPVPAQIHALHRTVTVSAVLVFLALLLSLHALWAERRRPARDA